MSALFGCLRGNGLNLKVTGGASRAYKVEYQEKLETYWQFQRVVTTDASGPTLIPVTLPITGGTPHYRVTTP